MLAPVPIPSLLMDWLANSYKGPKDTGLTTATELERYLSGRHPFSLRGNVLNWFKVSTVPILLLPLQYL